MHDHREHVVHRQRPHQRHRVHLHRHGHQRHRHRTRRRPRQLRPRRPPCRAPRPSAGHRNGDGPATVTFTATGVQRRRARHQLHRDLHPRWHHRHLRRLTLHGHRADYRHHLHLQGRGHQRRRLRARRPPPRTRSPPPAPRAPPTSVTATSYANTQSVVSWTAPSPTAARPITSYTVTSSGGQTCTTPNGTTTTCTVDRAHQRHQLHLHGHRHQRGSAPVRPPPPRRRPSRPPPGAPTGVSGGRRLHPGAPSPGRAPASNGGRPSPGTPSRRAPAGQTCTTSTTILHGHRSHQRHHLHLHGDGHQLGRHRSASAASNSVIPATTVPSPPSNVSATSYANAQSVVTLDRAGLQRRRDHHQYTVTSSPGRQDLHHHRRDHRAP